MYTFILKVIYKHIRLFMRLDVSQQGDLGNIDIYEFIYSFTHKYIYIYMYYYYTHIYI
jgi:hypothetical protein